MFYTSIERAVDNFETEYNYLPYVGATYPNAEGTYWWQAPQLAEFFGILLGLESDKNFKKIGFLEMKEAEGSGSLVGPGPSGYKDGFVISGETATLFNKHGMHYNARLDHDLDGSIFCNTLDETVTGKTIIFWTPDEPVWNRTRPDWITSW